MRNYKIINYTCIFTSKVLRVLTTAMSKPETKFSVTTNFRNVNLDEKNSIILIADVNSSAIYIKKTQLMHENIKESDVN